MKRKKKPKTLKELRESIRAEVGYVGIKPDSHNIIGVVLWQISAYYGDGQANKAIRDFGLEELGWSQVKPTR